MKGKIYEEDDRDYEEGKDWRKVQFPKNIGQKEARKLCRYLAYNLDGNCYLSLSTKKQDTFGQRFQERERRPKSLEEIPMIPGTVNLAGGITRTTDLSQVEFVFSFAHQERMDRTLYKGLELSFGVYDWDEISPQNRDLVNDVKDAVHEYFSGR